MNERLQELLDAVQRTASQVGGSAADAAYGMGKRAGELLSVAKLNIRIMDLKGAVSTALREVGEMIYATHTGTPTESEVLLAKLQEIDALRAQIGQLEQEIARLGADSRIGVGVAALGDRVFPAGKIEKGAVANPAAHTYDVRATLDNAAGELLPGMVCRVTVSPAESAEEIAVPLRAVQQAGDGSRFVWTVRGDSAVRTAVTTGRLVNNGIVLTGGVAAGDRIVVDGMQKIGEGSKVVWR